MRSGRSLVGYAVLALVLGALLAMPGMAWAKPHEAAGVQPGGTDLSGQVVDKDGKPVKQAEVFLYYSYGEDGVYDRFVEKTKTKGKGKFVFKEAVAWPADAKTGERDRPKYTVAVRHPKLGIAFVNVTQDDPADQVKVAMVRFSERRIQVRDKDGKPVEGAKVFLCSARFPKSGEKEPDLSHRYMRLNEDIGISSGVTDADGRITVVAPYDASYKVIKDTYAEGYFDGKSTVILFPGAKVSGKASDGDGKPLANTPIVFEYQGNRLSWSTATITDSEGRYAFDNLPSAGFRYPWMKPEEETGPPGKGLLKIVDLPKDYPFVYLPKAFPINPGDALTQDIALAKGVVFAGKVIDLTSNAPVKAMKLRSYFETGGNYLDAKDVVTDDNGAFRMLVPSGAKLNLQWEPSREDATYLIDEEWQRQNHWQAFSGVITQDTLDKELQVKLMPVQAFHGKVVDGQGTPVADAKVYVRAEADPAVTNAAGEFEMKAAPSDRDFQLMACTDANVLSGVASLKTGTSEGTITVEATETYQGRAVTPEGLPAGDLSFYIQPKINDHGLYRIQTTIKTNKDGEFTAKNLCPKAVYEVFWSADNDQNRDYDYGNTTVNLAKLDKGAPIQFEAKQYLNALLGRVVNERGEPIQGARVETVSRDVRRQNEQAAIQTDEKGQFEVPRLASGNVTLRVLADGYTTARVTAPTNSFDVEVRMKPAAEKLRLAIKVADQAGKPVPKAPVTLTQQTFTESEPKKEVLATTADGNGVAVFQLKPLPLKDAPRTRAVIACDVPGYTLAYRGVRLDEERELVMQVRKDAPCWNVTVLDENDKPVSGAKVHLVSCRDSAEEGDDSAFANLDTDGPSFSANAEGRAEFTRIGKQYSVNGEVTMPNYCMERFWFDAKRDADAEKVIRLKPGGNVEGRIVLKGSETLVPRMRVILQNQADGRSAASDDGTFTVDGLREGDYRAFAQAIDKANRKYVCPVPAPVTVTVNSTSKVTVEVVEGVAVRGTFLEENSGKPLKANCGVQARKKEDKNPAGWARPDENGAWEMYLPEGEYDLVYAVEPGNKERAFKSIKAENGKPIEGLAIEYDLLQEDSTVAK